MEIADFNPYLSPAVLAMGVIIGWIFALRAQAREKILGTRDSICSLAEMLLEENPEELDKIGAEAYFERPRFATWRKSKWDSTAVICNTETKKAKGVFVSRAIWAIQRLCCFLLCLRHNIATTCFKKDLSEKCGKENAKAKCQKIKILCHPGASIFLRRMAASSHSCNT